MPSFTQSVRQRITAGEKPSHSGRVQKATVQEDVWQEYLVCYATVFCVIVFSIFFYVNLEKIPFWFIAWFASSKNHNISPINSVHSPIIIPPSATEEQYVLHEPESMRHIQTAPETEASDEAEEEEEEKEETENPVTNESFSHKWWRRDDIKNFYSHQHHLNDWNYSLPFSSPRMILHASNENFEIGSGVFIADGEDRGEKGEVIANENGLWRVATTGGGDTILIEGNVLKPLSSNETYDLIWGRSWACWVSFPEKCSPEILLKKGPFNPKLYIATQIESDDTLYFWVPFRHLHEFVAGIIRRRYSTIPIVLLTSDGIDEPPNGELKSFSKDVVREILALKNLKHWFTTNYCPKVKFDPLVDRERCIASSKNDNTSSKISPLPAGLNFKSSEWPLYKTNSLYYHIHGKKNEKRDVKILCLLSTDEDVQLMSDILPKEYAVVKNDEAYSREERFKEHREFAFFAHPRLHSSDAWRIWDALTLGCIVIVQSSSLDSLYEGLPVVIVNSWDEISQEKLKSWHEQYKEFTSINEVSPKLKIAHWMLQISEFVEGLSKDN